MSLGNLPEDIRSLAAEMDVAAAQTRSVATDLRTTRETLEWRSTAADAFAQRLADRAGEVDRGAMRVEDVAVALRAHADGVETTFAAIRAARDFLLSAAAEARSFLSTVVDGVVDFFSSDVSNAEHTVQVAENAPADDLDLRWMDDARRIGWSG